MKCRHRRLVQWFYPDPIREMTCVQHRCGDCDITLPLGPSNDSDPRVQLEMRAAEIAAALDGHSFTNEEFVLVTAFSERRGWAAQSVGIEWHPDWANSELAGYLARQIAQHDDHDTRCSTEWEE